MYPNDRYVVGGFAFKEDGSLADAELQAESAAVVTELQLTTFCFARVDVEAQRIQARSCAYWSSGPIGMTAPDRTNRGSASSSAS